MQVKEACVQRQHDKRCITVQMFTIKDVLAECVSVCGRAEWRDCGLQLSQELLACSRVSD